ncbi:hypothetical protein ACV3P1_12725 [Clostridium perfringens]|uniref:hypothetical protein n=1 Tax=Clostridium perfringens TaxID=1502 RepID=UPI0039EA061F|nr:hypothetical protein [Clostridium perfringens]
MKIVRYSIHIIDEIGKIENVNISNVLDTCLIGFKIEKVSDKEIVFINESGEVVTIKPQGIIYTRKGKDVGNESIYDKLRCLLNVLNVKEEFKGAIELTAVAPVKESAFRESLKEVTISNENLSKIENITGIGIRIFNETDTYTQDFKKEPFIANHKLFYYNLTRLYNKKNIDLLTLTKDLNNIYINKNNEFI